MKTVPKPRASSADMGLRVRVAVDRDCHGSPPLARVRSLRSVPDRAPAARLTGGCPGQHGERPRQRPRPRSASGAAARLGAASPGERDHDAVPRHHRDGRRPGPPWRSHRPGGWPKNGSAGEGAPQPGARTYTAKASTPELLEDRRGLVPHRRADGPPVRPHAPGDPLASRASRLDHGAQLRRRRSGQLDRQGLQPASRRWPPRVRPADPAAWSRQGRAPPRARRRGGRAPPPSRPERRPPAAVAADR